MHVFLLQDFVRQMFCLCVCVFVCVTEGSFVQFCLACVWAFCGLGLSLQEQMGLRDR